MQCIAGYGGGLPQKLHLTLVSPLAVVVVNTSSPVGGEVGDGDGDGDGDAKSYYLSQT